MEDNIITMGIISSLKKALGFADHLTKEFENILSASIEEYSHSEQSYYSVTLSKISVNTQTVLQWNDSKKVAYIVFLTDVLKRTASHRTGQDEYAQKEYYIALQYVQTLLKSTLQLTEEHCISLYAAFKTNFATSKYSDMILWSYSGLFKLIDRNFSAHELPESCKNILLEITCFDFTNNSYYHKEHVKLAEKIKAMLYASNHPDSIVRPAYFIGNDEFKKFANELIDRQDADKISYWFQLVDLAQKATGSKPTRKFLTAAKGIIDQLGESNFKEVTKEWFSYLLTLKETITTQTHTYNNRDYTYSTVEFLSSFNADAIKGFVWMCIWLDGSSTIQLIGALAERCYKKIPQKGPAAAGIGNACLYTLFASKGLDGIAQLSRLKLKIKQSSTQSLIEKYIDEAAKERQVSSAEIEDISVDDFKLLHHKLLFDFDEFTCTVALTGIGKSSVKWHKADGTEQKTVPTAVKEKHAGSLKSVKDLQKQLDQATSSQKERLDRMLRCNRVMQLDYFKDKYLNHPLLSFVIQNMIFKFSGSEKEQLAIYTNNEWIDLNYTTVEIDTFTHVTLWHPVTSSTDEVKNWRNFLVERQIQQPFKQAYREIYLLTDAEINTRTYSNRMASHVLKQHQYVSLAKGRNWKARLIGAWDGGDQDTASLNLPEYNLRAEYWVNALNADNEYNASGIWNYVTTDQIRFITLDTNQLVELIDVPPIAFSEAMRDVDLFVGVASVGNDPTWSDSGGIPLYRDYWQSYSFGDLSEIAKNRKEILQRLIPRLKIASVTYITDKFVVVQGKLRTYKIHIGSTNILMEPNDQYLCIVPDRSKKNEADTVFLPFEGDNGLSVIISKAILLANDHAITDTTITSQIHRK